MAVTLKNLNGKLPDVLTFPSGPLTIYYRSVDGTPFPPTKAKAVKLTGKSQKFLLPSSETATKTDTGTFLFKADNEERTLMKLRFSSAQIESMAIAQEPFWVILVKISTDEDEDDEPTAQQKIDFSTEAQEYYTDLGEINIHINGDRFEVLIPTGTAGSVATFSDLLEMRSTLSNTAIVDVIVIADETDEVTPGRTNKYLLTSSYYSRYAFI